jgi:hypothetical protein
VPDIARFYGIILRMYSEAGGQHHRTHLHAYAAGTQGVVAVDRIEILSGNLSSRNERLILAWAELHRSELAELGSATAGRSGGQDCPA